MTQNKNKPKTPLTEAEFSALLRRVCVDESTYARFVSWWNNPADLVQGWVFQGALHSGKTLARIALHHHRPLPKDLTWDPANVLYTSLSNLDLSTDDEDYDDFKDTELDFTPDLIIFEDVEAEDFAEYYDLLLAEMAKYPHCKVLLITNSREISIYNNPVNPSFTPKNKFDSTPYNEVVYPLTSDKNS